MVSTAVKTLADPARQNRRTRFSLFSMLPLLLFCLLTGDFGSGLFAQGKTPEQKELARKRNLLANPNRDVRPPSVRGSSGVPTRDDVWESEKGFSDPLPANSSELLAQAFKASRSILIESESVVESLRRWESGEISKKEVKKAMKASNRRLKQQVGLLRRNRLLQWIDYWSPHSRSTQREPLPDGGPSELAEVLETACQQYLERILRLLHEGIMPNDLKEPGLIKSTSRIQKLGSRIITKIA